MRCMCLFQHMFTGIDKDGDKCITKAEFMTEMMKPSRSWVYIYFVLGGNYVSMKNENEKSKDSICTRKS